MMAQLCYQVPLISEMKVIVRWTNFPTEIQFLFAGISYAWTQTFGPKSCKNTLTLLLQVVLLEERRGYVTPNITRIEGQQQET